MRVFLERNIWDNLTLYTQIVSSTRLSSTSCYQSVPEVSPEGSVGGEKVEA